MSNRTKFLLTSLKLILIGFLITSCSEKAKVDTSKIKIDYQLDRFEQDLFNPEYPMDQKVPELENKYGLFFYRFSENILKTSGNNSDQMANTLKNFVYDSDIQNLYKQVSIKFENFDPYDQELEEALKLFHFYFPDKLVPQVVTFVSGFNYSVAVTDSTLAIGLDMFMGSDFEYYEMLRLPEYKRKRLDSKYLTKDAILGWLQSEFVKNEQDKTFLNEIIHQGKLYYILENLFPKKAPYVLMGYSQEKWDWCKNNEKPMWGHFVSNKTFYSSSFNAYHKYINEGPFTTGFDRASPDKTGYYVGWQIVRAYMSNNDVTMQQLINSNDPQEILNKSGYKPSK